MRKLLLLSFCMLVIVISAVFLVWSYLQIRQPAYIPPTTSSSSTSFPVSFNSSTSTSISSASSSSTTSVEVPEMVRVEWEKDLKIKQYSSLPITATEPVFIDNPSTIYLQVGAGEMKFSSTTKFARSFQYKHSSVLIQDTEFAFFVMPSGEGYPSYDLPGSIPNLAIANKDTGKKFTRIKVPNDYQNESVRFIGDYNFTKRQQYGISGPIQVCERVGGAFLPIGYKCIKGNKLHRLDNLRVEQNGRAMSMYIFCAYSTDPGLAKCDEVMANLTFDIVRKSN